MDVLLCLLDGAQPPTAEVPARVVVARLLAAHATAGGTQLRAETALATAEPGHETERDETARAFILFAKERSNGCIGFGDQA